MRTKLSGTTGIPSQRTNMCVEAFFISLPDAVEGMDSLLPVSRPSQETVKQTLMIPDNER